MHSSEDLSKTDALERVRTPAARHEALQVEFARSGTRTPAAQHEALQVEFARSGTSAKKFAQLSGINYQTFATWVQKQRREGGLPAGTERLV